MKIQVSHNDAGDYKYEIIDVDFHNKEYVWHSDGEDEGYSSFNGAFNAAHEYMEEPGERTQSEGMSFTEQMANYQRLK